jgi:hypothetical protein
MSHEIAIKQPNAAELMRQATDVAGVSREIVLKTACNIKGRKYVKIEGWQAIAVAHGCILSARDVEKVDTGIRAIGEVRRIDSGVVIATAEGFVGFSEATWGNREEYAQRAMAQTRAMSRAARSAFAHVVVMIDSNLSTTPFEEVPEEGYSHALPAKNPIHSDSQDAESPKTKEAKSKAADPLNNKYLNGKWKDVVCCFGKKGGPLRGKLLGTLPRKDLAYLRDNYKATPWNGVISPESIELEEALKAYAIERQIEKDRAEVVQEEPEDVSTVLEKDNIPF